MSTATVLPRGMSTCETSVSLEKAVFGEGRNLGSSVCQVSVIRKKFYADVGRWFVRAFTKPSSCLVVQHSNTPSQYGSYAAITESP
jgi:hypothetical protein